MFDLYAEIALRLPIRQTFTYRLPEEWRDTAQPGCRVGVSFNNRSEEGIIYKIHNNEPEYKTLLLDKLLDSEPILSNAQMELAA